MVKIKKKNKNKIFTLKEIVGGYRIINFIYLFKPQILYKVKRLKFFKIPASC